ncbi:cytochrome C oxidase subunit IV family protein [Zhongshania aquimaris]|uniref:Cytochrome C oxidase subunit IV family protein n=1 Tax=Zhongshania aquimaris TaxID=2857107 RepID=A0ABS6VVY8_9GAMM|nr:cytochrome C oxidase subunit IV family protein [Zhongshania aquimaris]MBW2942483.1 cytochrome C oxidase subunit IV family protein [Zhongshania aquimaris]
MAEYLRNPLCQVWAFLSAMTLASWWVSQGGFEFNVNVLVTVTVLLVSALKVHLVVRYFMEVNVAPRWLKRTMNAWLIVLLALLLGFYFFSL